MEKKIKKLAFKDITVRISEEDIKKCCEQIEEFEIIGQPRALKALRIGTRIQAKGYNIFVTGLSGTGKRTAIRKILKNIELNQKKLLDIGFVFNFKKIDRPKVLYFPKGKAKEFKKDLHNLIENLKSMIKVKLESKSFQTKKDSIVKVLEQQENKILSEFELKLSKDSFQIVQMGEGEEQVTDILPVYKGETLDFDELQSLVKDGEIEESYWNIRREKYFQYMDEMKKIFGELRLARTDMEEKIRDLGTSETKPGIKTEIEQLCNKYKDKRIEEYLDELSNDITKNVYLFTKQALHKNKEGRSSLTRYGLNIVVDNTDAENVPVIFEPHPNYTNLFGTVESRVEIGGEIKTSFMMIRGGSLIQANGGFLILNAEDILREEVVWQSLKNVLMRGQLEIQQIEGASLIPGSKIKSEPLDVDVKVIIIGNPNLYDILYTMDEDFQKLFKVSAEFDSVIKRTPQNTRSYVSFIIWCARDHGLKPIKPGGIARVMEYGIRIAERKDCFTTRFSQISDIIKEADYWAEKMKKDVIDKEAVKKAIEERNYLYNLPEEKIQENIFSGNIIISVTGKSVGKVNGLAVYDRGYYSFGKPTLITARISPGEAGIINIEREAGLSGEFHDKGIFILDGLLRSRYARDFPLSVTASICFEQSYSSIDGDSASSAEVFALLSAIAEIPLRQDIAVTGSVNQMGEIQPIGGVTEKVEGFFKVCKQINFTGDQGVIIPVQNINNLILSEEVENEVKNNRFSIYAISNIDEGIEILTNKKVGERNEEMVYPEGSFNFIIENRLKMLAKKVKEYGGN